MLSSFLRPLAAYLLAAGMLGLLIAPAAGAQIESEEARFSFDVSVGIPGGAIVDADDDVRGIANFGLDTFLEPLGPLPTSVDVSAFHLDANGTRLFAIDRAASLGPPPGVLARRGDVIRWDGVGHTIVFDARAEGIAPGTAVDAISRGPGGDLLLSFDVATELDGLLAADEDLVAWDGSSFSIFFDGSAAGIDRALDIDAANYFPNEDALWVSFDASGTLAAGEISFVDTDAVEWSFPSGAWIAASPAELQRGSDLDALHAITVPEPGLAASLSTAALWIASGCRRRRVRVTRAIGSGDERTAR